MLKNKSFTLLEMVIATFVITVGTLGTFALIQRTIIFTSINASQLAASYLAQEGIENVRNKRDSNWLKQRTNPGVSWNDGINSEPWVMVNFLDGNPSKFQRKITITPVSPPALPAPQVDEIIVTVEVSWTERGNSHKVTAATELYDWK